MVVVMMLMLAYWVEFEFYLMVVMVMMVVVVVMVMVFRTPVTVAATVRQQCAISAVFVDYSVNFRAHTNLSVRADMLTGSSTCNRCWQDVLGHEI